jgi:hypothetical protein
VNNFPDYWSYGFDGKVPRTLGINAHPALVQVIGGQTIDETKIFKSNYTREFGLGIPFIWLSQAGCRNADIKRHPT